MRKLIWALTAVAAAAALAGGVLIATAAGRPRPVAAASGCRVPSLPGQVVGVMLADMGRRGMMGGGMMRILLSQSVVTAGTVSLRVVNDGVLTHELVVLPLAAGRVPGERAIRPDGTVSEAGSLGEASATCRPGAGAGIASGAAGWVTLRLRPGRYELVCNLPGHYASGMYAELDAR